MTIKNPKKLTVYVYITSERFVLCKTNDRCVSLVGQWVGLSINTLINYQVLMCLFHNVPNYLNSF